MPRGQKPDERTPGNIVISYRREDSPSDAGRLYDHLAAHFGKDHVFLDVDNIPPGVDFVQHIRSAIGACDVLIAVVGPRWDVRYDNGRRRIADRNDFVRLELESALEREIPVIPLLVGGARMPSAQQLPNALKPFAVRNAFMLDHVGWERDVQSFIDALERLLEGRKRAVDRPPIKPPVIAEPAEPAFEPDPAKPEEAPRVIADVPVPSPLPVAGKTGIGAHDRKRIPTFLVPLGAGLIVLLIVVALVLARDPAPPIDAGGEVTSPSPTPPSETAGTADDLVSALNGLKPTVLAKPSFPVGPPQSVGGGGVKLTQASSEVNEITDEDAWFADTGLKPPGTGERLAGVPQQLLGRSRSAAWGGVLAGSEQPATSSGPTFVAYGRSYEDDLLIALDVEAGEVLYAFDFSKWLIPPEIKPGDEDYIVEGIVYAIQVGDVLYVSNAHNTYAESSRNSNAYITALQLPSGKILWRSPGLVSNSGTFVVVAESIITGYGFTAEDDSLYVIDADSGAVQQRILLPSGPDILILRDETLYVRTYDRNMTFTVG